MNFFIFIFIIIVIIAILVLVIISTIILLPFFPIIFYDNYHYCYFETYLDFIYHF